MLPEGPDTEPIRVERQPLDVRRCAGQGLGHDLQCHPCGRPVHSEGTSHASQQHTAYQRVDVDGAGSRAASGGSGLRGVDSAADAHPAVAHRGCRDADRLCSTAGNSSRNADCHTGADGRGYRHTESCPTTADGANRDTDADNHTHARPLRLPRGARSELVDTRTAARARSFPITIQDSITGELDLRIGIRRPGIPGVGVDQNGEYRPTRHLDPRIYDASRPEDPRPLCVATLELHFEVVEYLKGTGPAELTVEIPMSDTYLDDDRLLRLFHLEEEARLNAAEWWSWRSPLWDDRLAVLFLKRDEHEEVNLTFTDRGWGYGRYYVESPQEYERSWLPSVGRGLRSSSSYIRQSRVAGARVW